MGDWKEGLGHRGGGKKKTTKKLRDARRAVFLIKQKGDKNTDHF